MSFQRRDAGPSGRTPAAYEVLTATVCACARRRWVWSWRWCSPPSAWRCRRSSTGTCTCGTSRRCTPTGTRASVGARSLRWSSACWRGATPSTSRSRLSWGRLLVATYAGGLAWMLALALVDGDGGVGDVLNHPYEYLNTARATTDLPATLDEYVSRIPYAAEPDNWPVHIAGHPPGALTLLRRPGPDRPGRRLRGRVRRDAHRGLDGRRRAADDPGARRRVGTPGWPRRSW